MSICTLSLKSASVPEDWEEADVTLVFKMGSRGIQGNYKPVRLTSVPGKLVKTVIKDIDHIKEQSLLRKNHRNYFEEKSCLINFLKFFIWWTSKVLSPKSFTKDTG